MNNIEKFTGEYRFLSNFYPCEVMMDGKWYPSVENAYQAAKTLDSVCREAFQTQTHEMSAAEAKKIGRKLRLREDWESIKIPLMRNLLKQKFSDSRFKQRLLDTKDAELIEGNRWGDTFWGVCNGKGENWLGRLLMEIRDEFNKQS